MKKVTHIRLLEAYNPKTYSIDMIGAIAYYENAKPEMILSTYFEKLKEVIANDSEKKEDVIAKYYEELKIIFIKTKELVSEYRRQNPFLTYDKIEEKGIITKHSLDKTEVRKMIENELNEAMELGEKGLISEHKLSNIPSSEKVNVNDLKKMLGLDINKIRMGLTIGGLATLVSISALLKHNQVDSKNSTDIVVEMGSEVETIIEPSRPAGEDDYDTLRNMAHDYFVDPSEFPNGMDYDWILSTFGNNDPEAVKEFFIGSNMGSADGYRKMDYSFYEDLQESGCCSAVSDIVDANSNNISSVVDSIMTNTINEGVSFYAKEKERKGIIVDTETLKKTLSKEFKIIAFNNMYGYSNYNTDIDKVIEDLLGPIDDDKMLKDCANAVADVAEITGNLIPTAQQGLDGNNAFIINAGNFLAEYNDKYTIDDMFYYDPSKESVLKK